MLEELRILSPTAILGYGFPLASFEKGMAKKPHVIAVDAGSTDPGPYYLGSGISFTDNRAVKRDLEIMIPAAQEAKIPLIIGSAGGAGGKSHVDLTLGLIREIIQEKQLSALKIAIINSEISPVFLLKAYREGKIHPLNAGNKVTETLIKESSAIVGQMGEGPFIEALNHHADIILAGRAYDPSVFAALAIKEGFDKGLALHLGKILECAAIAALPGSGSDSMLGILRKDHFDVEPLAENRVCTTLSVAAHTLYEKSDPYHLPGPGGELDLTACEFKQLDACRVRVSGTKFIPTKKYFIKLEGARKIGYRTIAIAGVTDPIMIANIDSILIGVKERVFDNFQDSNFQEFYLNFNVYGKNGIALLPEISSDQVLPDEIGIVIEAVAATEEEASAICSFARSTALHFGYEGRISTAGNLAFPFSPSDANMGEVYEFSIYHLLEVESEVALFPIQYVIIGEME